MRCNLLAPLKYMPGKLLELQEPILKMIVKYEKGDIMLATHRCLWSPLAWLGSDVLRWRKSLFDWLWLGCKLATTGYEIVSQILVSKPPFLTRLNFFCCSFTKNSLSNIFKFSSLKLQMILQVIILLFGFMTFKIRPEYFVPEVSRWLS